MNLEHSFDPPDGVRFDVESEPGVTSLATPPPVPPVDTDSTAREVIRAALARSVNILVDELPGTVDGSDPEHLHQARVATRRMRSDLRTFGPLLDLEWSSRLSVELKWAGASLGEVRDLDVLLGIVDGLVEREPSLSPHDVAPLRAWFERERDTRRARLLHDVTSERFGLLLVELCEAARDPRTAPQADDPADEVLPALARRPWRTLERAVDQLGKRPTDTELHAIRIHAKRCRYAVEAVAPTSGRAARKFAKAIADVQECLGDLNDAVVIGRHLHEAADADPDVAFVAGTLSGVLTVRAAHCRTDFRQVWKQASRPELRAWW
jgi:CHAD domain-containing protein